MKSALSRFFILLGISFLFFGIYLVYLRTSPKTLTFEKVPLSIASNHKISPEIIQIPSINIILPIVSAISKGNSWETTNNGVSYLSSSPLPGSEGNSILYGHNWSSLLGNLSKIKPGEKIIITMNGGTHKVFIVEYTAVVNPNQTYILDKTNDTRITLYTCTGLLDSKRFVVVAKPVS